LCLKVTELALDLSQFVSFFVSLPQLWESSTGRIFAMTDFALQQEHAGAASAKDCPWFTDNPLLQNWYHRNSTEDIMVVLVGTGSFTGA
jgi:hypothetical protein